MEIKNHATRVKRLRRYRKYHRIVGLILAALLLISATTGLLLGWKKNSDLIQPPTQKGLSKTLEDWKSVAELIPIAQAALEEKVPALEDYTVDRLDFRPSKGIVKVLFEKAWWEVQLDCTSGEVLSIAKRHSDWIEALHDGSIISDTFKLVSMNLLGLGLALMIVTGIWLWYGPKVIRRLKK